MLQFIRDNATGWIAWGIVILISIPFALWGIHQYVTPDSSVAVATVDDTEIGYYDFQRSYARSRQQLQSLIGTGLIGAEEDARLRRDVLEGMIDSEVIVRSAVGSGMRVGDEQLASTIQSQDVFQSGNAFSQEAYEGWLRSQGFSPGGFEEDLRRSLLEQQIAVGISESEFVSASGVRDAVRVRMQTRTFSLLTIPALDFQPPEPTDSEIRNHFEQHRVEYMAPERLRLRYLEVSMDEIAAGVKADDEELRALFDAEPDRFVTPEKREVSHILVAVPSDAGDDDVRARDSPGRGEGQDRGGRIVRGARERDVRRPRIGRRGRSARIHRTRNDGPRVRTGRVRARNRPGERSGEIELRMAPRQGDRRAGLARRDVRGGSRPGARAVPVA